MSIVVQDSELGNGLRSVCNGEANHPGPPTAATQGDGRLHSPILDVSVGSSLMPLTLRGNYEGGYPLLRIVHDGLEDLWGVAI